MRTEDTHLFWTDDEVQLLLETARDFRAKKAYEVVDWESITQQDLRAVLPFANSIFFLISRFCIIIATMVD